MPRAGLENRTPSVRAGEAATVFGILDYPLLNSMAAEFVVGKKGAPKFNKRRTANIGLRSSI
jgi:hypothetical protein